MKLTELAIKNKVATLTLIILAVLGGIMAYKNMPKAENPGFTIRAATVITFFPGASSTRVEELVTDKIEEAAKELPELKNVTSTSKNGFSMVTIEVKNEYYEMQPIWDKLRRKVEGIKGDLPNNIYGPIINDEFGDVFGTIIGISGEGYTYKELKDIADMMKDELINLKNVAKVHIIGEQEERIFVEYKNDKLAEIGLSPYQLQGVLAATNIVIPGGDIFLDRETLSLEPSGNFNSIEDVKRIIISAPNSNQLFYLEDIADVRRAYVDPPSTMLKVSGKPALALAVSMKDGGNIINLGESVKSKLKDFERFVPIGIDMETISFQPKLVNNKVNSFAASLIQSVITVMIVLLIFLGFRTGVIVAAMIPIIIFITFLIMSTVGVMIEQVSLAALIIALGMLVDNAIVVSESIMVKMEHGKKAIEAAVQSAGELVLPLLISTLTTCSAFLPIGLAKSNVGEFCVSMFKVVSITLLTSWLLAITLIPLLCVLFLKVEKKDETYNSPFYRVYRNLLIKALKYKYISLVVLIVMFLAGMTIMGKVPFKFMPDSDKPIITAEVRFPGGTSFQKTKKVMDEIDEFIEKELKVEDKQVKINIFSQLMAGGTLEKYEKDGILNWGTFIGESAPRFTLSFTPTLSAPEYSFMLINVTSAKEIPAISKKLESFAIANYPEIEIDIKKLEVGPPVGTPIQIRLMGKDRDKLYDIVNRVKINVRNVEGSKNIRDNWGLKAKKAVVNINQAKARKAGLTSQDVAGSLLAMVDGFEVSQYREKTDLIPIVLKSKEGKGSDFNGIQNSKIYSSSTGKATSLSQVADIEIEWEPSVIYRRDRLKTITVKANLKTGYNAMKIINEEIIPMLEKEKESWGYGYSYEIGGELETSGEAIVSIVNVLPIAGMAILLLLIAQFNSYKKVGVIIAIVPFLMVAISITMIISGRIFGFMPFLGLIALMGITINTSIVLMDRINTEMEVYHRDLHEAIVESAQARFRPIFLTTATTICGLVPLWLGGGPMFSTMALVMIGGLSFILFIVLGILPIMFSIFYGVNFKKYKYKVHDIDHL